MSAQRLSQLQQVILTTIRDAPPMQLGDDVEGKYLKSLSHDERLVTSVYWLRVGEDRFKAPFLMKELPQEGVPTSYVRWTLARQRQQVMTKTAKDRYGTERTKSTLVHTFGVDFSRSIRNLAAKGWLTLSNRYSEPVATWRDGQVFWVSITPAGQNILKAKCLVTNKLALRH